MSIQQLPSGAYRAQVYDPRTGRNVSVGKVLGGPSTFRTKREAKVAREKARERLLADTGGWSITVSAWRDRWLTDPLFARPKESTMLHNAERTKAFATEYGHVALDAVDDLIVARFLAGGRRNGHVPALRAMWNDAMSAKAGRVASRNPWSDLGLERSRGNADKLPPTQDQLGAMIRLAYDLTPPSFAAYLEFGSVTALRPGELDALQPAHIRRDDGEIDVLVQWNARTRKFTTPKYGAYTVALVADAARILDELPRDQNEGPFVFNTIRGTHYTPSARVHHWNRVRAAAGLGDLTLYLATRHYFGWYAVNVLGLDTSVVAEQLGHKDGGKLVEQLYGHPDKARRRKLIRDAHDAAGRVVRLDDHRKETG